MFRILSRLRFLRGTKLDLFGMTRERKMEQALIGEFEENIAVILARLSADNVDLAIDIVGEYLQMRGYGLVKETAVIAARERILAKLDTLMNLPSKAA